MGVKEQMVAILQSEETARIRFEYASGQVKINITADAFRRVANALTKGRLNVVEGRHSRNTISYSALKDGDDAANTFYLGNNNRSSRDFDALVVHESVHAFFDITRTEIPWADNEAIAYIAQGYYLRNSGFPESRMEMGNHYRLGHLIAGSFAEGTTAKNLVADLRSNLLKDPDYEHYIEKTFRGDG
jgi:hypothetical protein